MTINVGDDGLPIVQEADAARLEFNWHSGDERRTTIIEVVTEKLFLARLSEIVESDERLQEGIAAMR